MNDYIGADGLLYCGKCNTPKQCRITTCWGDRTVHQMCKCAADEYNTMREQVRRNTLGMRISEMRAECFSDSALKRCTFAVDDGGMPGISDICRKYVQNFDTFRERGEGLLLYGSCGSGKTFFASCIANAVIDRGYPALVTSFVQLANSSIDERTRQMGQFDRYALLVLDDLGAERQSASGYMQEMIYSVVDRRIRSGLPMIVTSNLTMEDIKKPKEIDYKRIYDRIMEKTVPVEVTGMNRRYRKINDTIGEYREILGM